MRSTSGWPIAAPQRPSQRPSKGAADRKDDLGPAALAEHRVIGRVHAQRHRKLSHRPADLDAPVPVGVRAVFGRIQVLGDDGKAGMPVGRSLADLEEAQVQLCVIGVSAIDEIVRRNIEPQAQGPAGDADETLELVLAVGLVGRDPVGGVAGEVPGVFRRQPGPVMLRALPRA